MTHGQPGEHSPAIQAQQGGGPAYGLSQPLVLAQLHGEPLPQMQQAGGMLEAMASAPQ